MFYSIDSIKFAYDIWVCKFRMELIVTFKFRLFYKRFNKICYTLCRTRILYTYIYMHTFQTDKFN